MARIRIPYNWIPRDYQMKLWQYLESGGKRACAIWHRRAGKDEVCLHWAARAAMKRPATYWHMLPEASQSRKAIWDAVNPHTGKRRIDEAFPLAIRSNTREQEMMIKFINGSTWQVLGSDNYDSVVGSPPAGIVFSEWALADPASWSYLMPIVEENGGWVFWITTPRGDNHAKRTHETGIRENDWFSQILTADDTGIFSEKQLAAILRQLEDQYGKARGNAIFMQEYFCSWQAAYTGAPVYPEFDRAVHVADKPLLPTVQRAIEAGGNSTVIRGWDHTGLHPAAVITYLLGNQWLVFKEFWEPDAGIEDFADIVKIWCANNLPGDTTYRDYGDPAGNKTRDARKRTAADYIRMHCGISIQPGIQTFKVRRECVASRLNRRDGILIDPTECPILIDGFVGAYSYPEIGHSGVFKEKISGSDKDKHADCHDSLQYIATRIFGPARTIETKTAQPPVRGSWMAL
jgi:hypothetical protein